MQNAIKPFISGMIGKQRSDVLQSTQKEAIELPAKKTPIEQFIELAETSTYNSGGSKWNRDALYDRKIAGR